MVGSVDANLVASILKLLHTFLGSDLVGGLDLSKNKDKIPNAKKAVQTYLGYSVIWSIGANTHDSSR